VAFSSDAGQDAGAAFCCFVEQNRAPVRPARHWFREQLSFFELEFGLKAAQQRMLHHDGSDWISQWRHWPKEQSILMVFNHRHDALRPSASGIILSCGSGVLSVVGV